MCQNRMRDTYTVCPLKVKFCQILLLTIDDDRFFDFIMNIIIFTSTLFLP
jgi:hypothetical protein